MADPNLTGGAPADQSPVTLEFHPHANLFPMIEGREMLDLIEDIREHGLRQPITLYEGKILDGRNRYLACNAAGVEPRFEQFPPDSDALEFVVSANLQRRHLTTGQRAAIAAELANMQLGDNQYRQEGTSFDVPSPDAKDEELREWAKSIDLALLFPRVFETRLIKVRDTCLDKLADFLEGGTPGDLLRRALKEVRKPEPTLPLVTEAQAAAALKVSKASVQRAKVRMRTDPEAHAAAKAGKRRTTPKPQTPEQKWVRQIDKAAAKRDPILAVREALVVLGDISLESWARWAETINTFRRRTILGEIEQLNRTLAVMVNALLPGSDETKPKLPVVATPADAVAAPERQETGIQAGGVTIRGVDPNDQKTRDAIEAVQRGDPVYPDLYEKVARLTAAIARVGGQVALAKAMNVGQGTISRALHGNISIAFWAKFLEIEGPVTTSP